MAPWKQTKAGREPTGTRNVELVRELREGKKTYAQLAGEYKISLQRVAQIREYAGIERRRKQRVGSVKVTCEDGGSA